LANGQRAGNGYLALSELDTNGDGIISATDANFADLMVWVDSNSDGVSQTPELHSLSSLGITQLDLKAQASTQEDNGNMVGLVSSYTTSDGAVHDMADVWFATSQPVSTSLTQSAAAVPPVLNLVVPPADSALATDNGGVPTAGASVSLTTQVGGLVDAMAAFDSAGASVKSGSEGLLSVKPETQANLTVSGGITGMVDALKQFDANGQALNGGGKTLSTAAFTALDTKPRKPDADILASGK
jgi:hypothetical protein